MIIKPIISTKLSRFLHDAKRFVLSYGSIADSSPLQLYSSALIFAPKESVIRKTFQNYIPGWISQPPKVELGWNAVLQTLEGHSSWVNSVAFSHDSKLLASASCDHTVKVWDAATGSLQQTLEGHSDKVYSVAFSHDSKLLASASYDHTIKVWDTVTCSCRQTITTSAYITSLLFDSRNLNLLTNIGCIKVDRPVLPPLSKSSQEAGSKGDRQGWGISGSWVTWNTQNMLWLPPDYRAVTSDISLSGSTVAIGCGSGKVFVIGFSSQLS